MQHTNTNATMLWTKANQLIEIVNVFEEYAFLGLIQLIKQYEKYHTLYRN